MIRMVDHDGDGQVCVEEFFKMITGNKPPASFSTGKGKHARQSHASPNNAGNMIADGMSPMGARTPKTNNNNNNNSNNNNNGSTITSAVTPLTGQAAIQARNLKRKSLHEFAKDHNLKPESIKRAHRRFQAVDKKKSGVIDYTEFCEVLQVDPTPQCEDLFKIYDYNKSGLIDAKELMIAVTNFTGAGKEDK